MVGMNYAKLLHDNDLKATGARLALLRQLATEPHQSAEALARALSEGQVALSSQAVYNAVNDLTDHGILRRFTVPGTAARYEIDPHDNHHHAVCVTCGRVENVPCAHGSAPCFHPGGATSFSIDIADVLFYGQCKEGCALGDQVVAG